MQLKFVKTLSPAFNGANRVVCVAWSPDSMKLAVAKADRVVFLYDEAGEGEEEERNAGEQRDRFLAKNGDKSQPDYRVTGMCFGPQGGLSKLAVAQTDNHVFVYKLGDWEDKKTICNKFQLSSSATCIAWPALLNDKILIGTSEGHVRVGDLRRNKSQLLYRGSDRAQGGCVSCMCACQDGLSVVVGHMDGSLYKYTFDIEQGGPPMQTKFGKPLPPLQHAVCLSASPLAILAATANGQVRFFDVHGGETSKLDLSRLGGEIVQSSLRAVSFNPSGDTVAVGGRNGFLLLGWSAKLREWREGSRKEVPFLYDVTSLGWKPDGSALCLGSVCGAVEAYDVCLRQARRKGNFEIKYVSQCQVTVRNLESGQRIQLRSSYGSEIQRINFAQNRFLVAHTPDSLLLGDMLTCKLSEIPWQSSSQPGARGGERFGFEYPSVAMIFKEGEMFLVEYGSNEILGRVRTELPSSRLISVRISGGSSVEENSAEHQMLLLTGQAQPPVRAMAYLLDLFTIRIVDLGEPGGQYTASHDSEIDWLELNISATKLLFRDKRRQLHLYDTLTQKRTGILEQCEFVQWVPESDVVVAQSRQQLCVWYSINAPDRKTVHEIKGDVEEIERADGRTCVVVTEGANTVEYELDEALINFGACVEKGNYAEAVDVLEELPLTPETEALWETLARAALDKANLPVAERCFAVVGDVATSRYLYRLWKRREKMLLAFSEEEGSISPGGGHPQLQKVQMFVSAHLAALNGQLAKAEALFVEARMPDEAVQMYQDLHLHPDAIRVCSSDPLLGGAEAAHKLKVEYLDWLLSTHQEAKAGELQEAEGNDSKALDLYLKGSAPSKAANVIIKSRESFSKEVTDRVLQALQQAELLEKAGDLCDKLENQQAALACYRQGKAHKKAVDLAKRMGQEQWVPALEKEWGMHLMQTKQVDAAISHFLQGGAYKEALESAVLCRDFQKAEQILVQFGGSIDPPAAAKALSDLATFHASQKKFDKAEKLLLAAQLPQQAVQMYIDAGELEQAGRVAKERLPEQERVTLYADMAKKLEKQGKTQEAEQLFLVCGDPASAVKMYENKQEYNHMLRLVQKYQPDRVWSSFEMIGRKFELDGDLEKAEHYFCSCPAKGVGEEDGLWSKAVEMYKRLDKWDDALRVARLHGGQKALEKVVILQAAIPGKQGDMAGAVEILRMHDALPSAVDFYLSRGESEFAMGIIRVSGQEAQLMPRFHLWRAQSAADSGDYSLAEREFLAAEEPSRLVSMYESHNMFGDALRVAEMYARDRIGSLLQGFAKYLSIPSQGSAEDLRAAERAFLSASKPEILVQILVDRGSFDQATRICKEYCPRLLAEVMAAAERQGGRPVQRQPPQGGAPPPSSSAANQDSLAEMQRTARVLEEQGAFTQAIDAYLKITPSICPDATHLEKLWLQAVRISSTNDRPRYLEILLDVGGRLMKDLRRFQTAGDLFVHAGKFQLAVQCYTSAELYQKALEAANQATPPELQRQLVAFVEDQRRQTMSDNKDATGLMAAGDSIQALQTLAQSQEWSKCLALAEKSAPEHLPTFVARYVQSLLSDTQDDKGMLESIAVLARYGAPLPSALGPSMSAIYNHLAYRACMKLGFSTVLQGQSQEVEGSPLVSLRDALVAVLLDGSFQQGQAPPPPSQLIKLSPPFGKWMFTLHLLSIRRTLAKKGGPETDELKAKIGVALCKSCDLLPVDLLFFEAGGACKASGDPSLGFFLLNRFLDIYEAIAEGSTSMLDNADFEETDIPSIFDITLPQDSSVVAEKSEEAKDWVLSASVDNSISQDMPSRGCDHCGTSMFVGACVCPSCKQEYEPCCASGYPVTRAEKVTCRACGTPANKPEWNAYVQAVKCCPWCKAAQSVVF